MTIGEFRELTEGIDDDAELIVVYQPHYPMQFTIGDAVNVDDHKVIITQNGEGNDYVSGEDLIAIGWAQQGDFD